MGRSHADIGNKYKVEGIASVESLHCAWIVQGTGKRTLCKVYTRR